MSDEEDLSTAEQLWAESRASGRFLHGWTIYDHPRDYPGHYVVREWRVGHGIDGEEHAPYAWLRASLDEARACVPPGLHRLPREPADDPVIIETWL